MEQARERLLGKSPNELKDIVKGLDMPAFSAAQIAKWMYGQGVRDVSEMTNISMVNRERLGARYVIGYESPVDMRRSADGTVKYLFPTESGKFVETVYIPDGERATLCVSSQVGCKMGCLFCQTGKQKFEGNLSVSDILNQIYALPERKELTNIVFMGQGEPLDNLENVLKSVKVLTADWGYGWSPKRITVSTVGIRKGLRRLLDECRCHVAISLHSAIHEQRLQLMPAERAMEMREIVELLRDYDFSHQRRLSFEYIMFDGVNDSMAHAKEVVRLLKGLDCRVNLLRFHRIPGVDLRSAGEEDMERFRDYLTGHGVFTTIRTSRGEDIEAACGMLTTLKENADKE